MGFLSTLFGGGEAYDEKIDDLNKQKTEATSYYKSMSKMNALDSSENQAALRAARELLTDSTRRAAATQAVTGASDAAVALEKKNATDALADITSSMAAQTTSRRDAAMQNYINANKEYSNAIANVKLQKANAEAQAVGGLINSAVGLGTSFINPVSAIKK